MSDKPKLNPPPRYDDVYFDGLAAIEANDQKHGYPAPALPEPLDIGRMSYGEFKAECERQNIETPPFLIWAVIASIAKKAALPDVAEGDFEHWWKSHAGPKNELAKLWAESAWSASKAAGAGEQRGEAPDDGTEHEFDDSDGIGECSVRVILPGNGWYRCGKTKEEHRPTGDAADQIVSSLYRRFKDWSKRGFGPDDVTWCEVKADVIALMRAELSRNHPSHAGYKAQEAQPLPARPKMRSGDMASHYAIDETNVYMNYLEAELSRTPLEKALLEENRVLLAELSRLTSRIADLEEARLVDQEIIIAKCQEIAELTTSPDSQKER